MPTAPRYPNEHPRPREAGPPPNPDAFGDQFDRIARLMAATFGVPLAVVTLVDESESVVIGSADGSRDRFRREDGCCAYTVTADEPLLVPDALQDERLRDLPLTHRLGLRFYAGAPVRAPGGFPIGTVCVGDTQPRAIEETNAPRLEDFAAIVGGMLATHRDAVDAERERSTIEALLEGSLAGIVHIEPVRDAEGEVIDFVHTHANGRASEIVGLSREELCASPHSQIYPNYYIHGCFDFFVEALRSGAPRFTEIKYEDDRLDSWYALSAVRHGTGLIVSYFDIAHCRAHGLETSEFFARSPDLFAVTDPHGVLLRAGGGWNTEFGIDPATIVGRPIWESFHPDDHERARAVTDAMTRGETMVGGLYRVRHADGTTRHVSWNAARSPIDGRIYAVGRDETERHRANEQLRLFIEHTPAAVAIFDRDMRYLAASRRWYQDYRLDQESILGLTHYEVFPEVPDRWKVDHQNCLAGEVVRSEEDPFLRADGSIQWLRYEIIPWRNPDGEIGGIAMFTEDITERKLAADRTARVNHELAAARDAAEAADRTKGAFLANMSHELRTPLSAIVGYAELLAVDPDPELRVQASAVIKSNGLHLLDMVNDVLDLSKIEADRLDFEPCEFRFADLIDEVIKTCAPRALAQHVEVRYHADAGTPETVHTDRGRLRQILLNLVVNAIKFSPGTTVRVHASSSGDDLVLDVEDTGVGMRDSLVEHLFQPFTQADASTSRAHGGTGLGLTISRRLARLLGGDVVCLRTTPGEGTVMRTRIPLGRPASRGAGDPDPMPIETPLRRHVLLAEDGPDNARLLIHLLTSAGATVDHAHDGREAVERALAPDAGHDLVLMDMQMPGLDGYAAVAELRARGYTRPIIALTAHALPEDRDRCLAAGCDDFVTKPIPRDDLLALCRRHTPGTTPHAA